MANNNQVELVVTVEVDKANKSIKTVNASLSSMEAAAAKSARGASNGIDGMTASMMKGAAAGAMLADGIKMALRWLGELTVGTTKYAARTEVLGIVSNQLAKVNHIAAGEVDFLVDRLTTLGITTQESHGVIQRMIFAELDLAKATELARVAQDAAVLSGQNSSEALENIILGITTGQTRLLHNMGLQVSLEQTIQEEEKRLGRAISETEKREAMLNKVLVEGVKIRGTYEAAMTAVHKQMTSLKRYFQEAQNAVGAQFMPEMRKAVDGLKDLALWLGSNASLLADLGRTIAAAAGMVGVAGLVSKISAIVASLGSLGAIAAANPIGLIAAGFVAAGAIIYSEWHRIQEPFRAMDEAYRKWLTEQVTGAKTGADLAAAQNKVGRAFEAGAISAKEYAQALDMIDAANARVHNWGNLSDFSKNLGVDIKVKDPKAEAAAAKALAEAIGKEQVSNTKAFRDRAYEASKAGLTGYAKDAADLNAEMAKRSTFTDGAGVSHWVPLTKAAWKAIIDEAQQRFAAFKAKVVKENREALADYMKDETEAAEERQHFEARLLQQRLANNEEIARQNLDHIVTMYGVEQERAGYARDRRLREVEGVDAQTLEQKLWVEQQKADIEVEYIQKTHQVKMKLFDLETNRMVLEEELTLKRLGYRADEIKARLDQLNTMRGEIRDAAEDGTDEAISAARENAANQQAQVAREHFRSIFDSLKEQAGGVFDALLSKSQSVWSAIGNSLKTALLTAIKEVVTSRVAAMLMQMFRGQRVTFAGGGRGAGGSGGGVQGGLGGLLGIGAAPVFGGSGGGAGGAGVGMVGSGPMAGNPLALSGLGALGGGGGLLRGAGAAGGLASFLGFGGGVQFAPGMATTWTAASMGQKLSALGKSNAALAGGSLLVMDGLRRGGWAGRGETAAGGAMIGFKYGGPIGALIGGIVGAAAGLVRMFVKGAQEKAREKIKALYGVDIADKGVLRQIVDTAKQAYGGNLDMAIRSQQIRDLVQLYAMSTGQGTKGMPATMHPLDMVQSGGSLYQSPGYSNGGALPGMGGLPTMDSIGGGVASGAGAVVIRLDGQATTALLRGEAVNAIVGNPRAVQGAAMNATRANAGRRQMAALQFSPGLVVA